MQNKNYKKVLTFALVLSMMMPIGSAAADSAADTSEAESSVADTSSAEDSAADDSAADDSAADTDSAAEDDSTADDAAADDDAASSDTEDDGDTSKKDEEEAAPLLTDDEALALESVEQIAENDNFLLYMDPDNERLCLKVKKTGKCWWTSPINADSDPTPISEDGDTMKSGQIGQAKSSAAINIGDLRQEKRTELPAPAYSYKASVSFKAEANGCAVTYNYTSYGVKLTVHYELKDDCLHSYVKTDEIVEKDSTSDEGKALTKIILAPYMGAVSGLNTDGSPTEGYMIVPDGSGAVINYNNGKTNYASYSQRIYGTDYTAVPLNAPRVTEQAYLPMVATVQGNNGLVTIVSEGDANVYANAQVSGQNKQAYNNAYFEFETRSSDEFFMSGTDTNKITVFEKYGIKTDTFGLEYYPLENDEGVNYADVAEVYRNYLINSKGLTQKTEANDTDLYVDTYGSVLKEESILGLPITMKTKLTTFSQASDIASQLNDAGADSIVMNYNDWTKASVKNMVSTKAKALGKLGSTDDFKNLNSDNLTVYGSVNNFTMEKGSWGYFELSNTAIRVSSAYSRQSSYSPAFGVAVSGVSPALIAPNTYTKIFKETIDSFTGNSVNSMGFGDWSTKLVSDFSKKNTSCRNDTMNTIVTGYSDAVNAGQSIIAEGANSYVLPYVSAVTDVPVYSSGFNLTDMDIPFYQMVIHGYVPYSTKAINASSDTDRTYMRALAAGSNVNYDMIYQDADELIDTRDDDLYYSHYSGWVQMAANQYKVTKKVLAAVSDYTISDYTVEGDIIKTTYSKEGQADVVIEVDTKNCTVKANGDTTDLLAEGAVEKEVQ